MSRKRHALRYALLTTLVVVVGTSCCCRSVADEGARHFAEKCAACHGPEGQGTDYYRIPLAGDLPISELTRVIEQTMPEGEPEACIDAEAEAIARWAYGAFYSPIAQARRSPPRRELSRLTARQHAQSLADLIGEFRWRKEFAGDRGLKVRYLKKQKTGPEDLLVERIEPTLEFSLAASDFLPAELRPNSSRAADETPDDKGVRTDVVLRASGGLYAPTSGEYEFRVDSPNGLTLSVNGQAIVDARIRSDGDDEKLSAVLRLVGGRVYPVTLSARRTRESDLKVTLLWRAPGRIEEVIPARSLSPDRYPEVYASPVAFPPDDSSVGYVRGASVSAEWDEAVTAAAVEGARTVAARLSSLIKKSDGKSYKEGELIAEEDAVRFCKSFASTAFRRELTKEESATYVDRFFVPQEKQPSDAPKEQAAATTHAVELSVLSILKSPRFLYPELGVATGPPETRQANRTAVRLALGLWDSLPDRQLKEAAKQGRLHQAEVAASHAERMLDDPRTRAKLQQFFEHWLRLDHVEQLSRDPAVYPDFSERIAEDMRTSLSMLLEDVVWNGDGDLRELFLTNEIFVNHRLADFLGVESPSDDPEAFVRVRADIGERAGVITHPYVVTAFSYFRETSPIHRGVFLARNVLGRALRPPPEAVAPVAPEIMPQMTTRERVATQTSPGACQACHVLINDLGFTLEHFDAVGRFRERDVGRPVDASGGYIATDGSSVELGGAAELAQFLADSEDVHRSFVTQLFQHVTKQPLLAYGTETRERLMQSFRDSNFNIRTLLAESALVAALAE